MRFMAFMVICFFLNEHWRVTSAYSFSVRCAALSLMSSVFRVFLCPLETAV